jgi:hypothetical protein
MKGRSWPTVVESAPQAMRRVCADLEVRIKRQLGRITRARLRRFSQAEVMLRAIDAQDSVPAVRRLPDAVRSKAGQW